MGNSCDDGEQMLVACLCAAWCRTCGDYRETFDALAREFGSRTRFLWVDVEDQEHVLGSLDVVDFPTLLIACADEIRFFGPVTPHAQAARQLVERALSNRLGTVTDALVTAVPARLRGLA